MNIEKYILQLLYLLWCISHNRFVKTPQISKAGSYHQQITQEYRNIVEILEDLNILRRLSQ
jgi:hypothetical protein